MTTRRYVDEQLDGDLAFWLRTLSASGKSHRWIAGLLTTVVGRPVSKTSVSRWLTEVNLTREETQDA